MHQDQYEDDFKILEKHFGEWKYYKKWMQTAGIWKLTVF